MTREGDGFRVQQSPDGQPKYSQLMSVRAYREVFPLLTTNIYHPHEASADLFAKLVLFDSYLSADGRRAAAEKERSFGPLRDWFRRNLAEVK